MDKPTDLGRQYLERVTKYRPLSEKDQQALAELLLSDDLTQDKPSD